MLVHQVFTSDWAVTRNTLLRTCVVAFMMLAIDWEAPMWIVEVNFAGRRFVHEVNTRRPMFRFGSRSFGGRRSQLQQTRAA